MTHLVTRVWHFHMVNIIHSLNMWHICGHFWHAIMHFLLEFICRIQYLRLTTAFVRPKKSVTYEKSNRFVHCVHRFATKFVTRVSHFYDNYNECSNPTTRFATTFKWRLGTCHLEIWHFHMTYIIHSTQFNTYLTLSYDILHAYPIMCTHLTHLTCRTFNTCI